MFPNLAEVKKLNTTRKPAPKKTRKTSVHSPTLSQIIFHRKNTANTQYYFTSGRKINKEKPPDLKWDNFAPLQNRDFTDRLRVAESPLSAKTILDVDSDFYSLIDGRPIKPVSNTKKYALDVRQNCIVRLQTSYLKDEILRIDENFSKEQQKYNEICSLYLAYVESFERYLSDDHKKSMDTLQESDGKASSLLKKGDELKELSVNLGKSRSVIHFLEEKCRNLKLCQKFLYKVSPLNWRLEHDYIHGVREGSEEKAVQTYTDDLTLDELVQKFRENLDDETPQLYFTSTRQLMAIFRMMELQNLNSLLHTEEMAVPLEQIQECMEHSKQQVKHEYKIMSDEVDDLMKELQWIEKRERDLENKVMRIIHTSFYKLYASEETLKLGLYVETAYMNVVAQKDLTLGSADMMRSIENLYESLCGELDKLDYSVVKSVQKEFYAEDLYAMKVANEGSGHLSYFKRLTGRLLKDIEPPYKKTELPEITQTNMDHQIIKPTTERKFELTEEELEYLTLFTEWCSNEDPLPFLQDYNPFA